jgi:hypothetical protein
LQLLCSRSRIELPRDASVICLAAMAVETGGARLYSRSRIELPRDASVIRLAVMAVETGGARSRGLICVVGLPGLPSLLEETKFLPLHTLLYTRGKSQFALKKNASYCWGQPYKSQMHNQTSQLPIKSGHVQAEFETTY